jgi:hypothetical protein
MTWKQTFVTTVAATQMSQEVAEQVRTPVFSLAKHSSGGGGVLLQQLGPTSSSTSDGGSQEAPPLSKDTGEETLTCPVASPWFTSCTFYFTSKIT